MRTEQKRMVALAAVTAAAVCAAVILAGKRKPREAQCADAVRKSLQGELDAVAMYDRLADTVDSEKDAAVFRRLSADESGHADVFRRISLMTLKPRHGKAILVPMLYRTIGREKTYRIIARGEYGAAKKYDRLLSYPEVAQIQADETRHGDTVLALIGEERPLSQKADAPAR